MIPEGVGVADGVDPEDVLLRGCGETLHNTTEVIPEGVGVADGVDPEDVLL